MDVPKEAIIEGLATYRGLPHRIEYTGSLGGVRFYNDSKATNPHAAITGMAAFDEKVVLIAGGFEKGLDLTEMGETIAQKCKSVVLTGATTKRMSKEFEGKAPIYCESTMELATKKALELAKPSGIVLLSPGASSFDNYTGFEQRGNHFKTIVRDLMNAADIASRSC
ncbi:MAG: UDP-N-acetylmuramoylalanine--D-glutamate ligase [Deltaproteobacteria bacterium ADurb.Bin058]|nr:MAG: UDP-N-acetylmuramoylalanine--D-glutamate ligase [Deltaproteobacteria bacterium ADurb.Bin058]